MHRQIQREAICLGTNARASEKEAMAFRERARAADGRFPTNRTSIV